MQISAYETWLEIERQDQQRYAEQHPAYATQDWQLESDQQRMELLLPFPYSAVLEGYYPEHDYAVRWCWQNFGPPRGICTDWHSEYPACPLVLATEYVETGTLRNEDGTDTPKKRVRYKDPGEHKHEGVWSSLWLGKTDYDYGFREYAFAREEDREQFLSAFRTFTFGEKYPDIAPSAGVYSP